MKLLNHESIGPGLNHEGAAGRNRNLKVAQASSLRPLLSEPLQPRWLRHPIRGSVLAVWLMTLAFVSAQGQEAIVGFYKLQLAPGLHLVAPPLAPLALDSGRATTVATNLLADGNAIWQPDQWAGHQIIFTSGRSVGWRYLVTGNTTNALHVIPDPLSEGVVGSGDGYEILPNLEQYFGDQLRGGTDAASGDRVGLYDWENPSAEPVLLRKDASGWWRAPDGKHAPVSVIAGQGFWLALASDTVEIGPARELFLVGRLSTWPGGGVPVEPGRQILSVPLPERLPLDGADWMRLGAVAGGTPEESDQLGLYEASSGELRRAWLSTGGWQWVPGSPLSALDPRLQPGQAFEYLHRGNGFFLNWSIQP